VVDASGAIRTSGAGGAPVLFVPSTGCNSAYVHREPVYNNSLTLGNVAVFTQGYRGYFHFLVEQLPKLFVSRELEKIRGSMHMQNVHMAPTDSSRYIDEILHLVADIDPKQRVRAPMVRSNRTTFVEPTPCGSPTMGALALTRAGICAALKLETMAHNHSGSPCSLLVIRRHGHREITNHLTLLAALESRFPDCAVNTFDSSEFSGDANDFVDMFRAFNRATALVGPHGAGFSNLIVARPRTVVVEVLPEKRVNPCFLHLSVRLGLQYNGIGQPNVGSWDAMGEVDTALVSRVLAQALRNQ